MGHTLSDIRAALPIGWKGFGVGVTVAGGSLTTVLAGVLGAPGWFAAFIGAAVAFLLLAEGGYRRRQNELADHAEAVAVIQRDRDRAQEEAETLEGRRAQQEAMAEQLRGELLKQTQKRGDAEAERDRARQERDEARAELERRERAQAGRSVFPSSELEFVIAEFGSGVEDIKAQAPLHSDQWLADSVATWKTNALARLEEVGADRLRDAVAKIELAQPGGPREYVAFLDGQIELFRHARGVVRAEEQSPVDRLEVLRAVYLKGDDLLQRLPWLEGAPESMEEAEQRERKRHGHVIEWLVEAWDALRLFPGKERKLVPEAEAIWGRNGLRMEVPEQLKRHTPESFMEAKLAFLAEVIEQEEERRR